MGVRLAYVKGLGAALYRCGDGVVSSDCELITSPSAILQLILAQQVIVKAWIVIKHLLGYRKHHSGVHHV